MVCCQTSDKKKSVSRLSENCHALRGLQSPGFAIWKFMSACARTRDGTSAIEVRFSRVR
jgi:hypothetical protein